MEANLTPTPHVEDPNLEQDGEHRSLPSVRANMALGTVSGASSANDIKVPFLSIAYGVGKLSQSFNPGDFVLGGEHLIAKRKEPLTVVILSAVKYFKERVSKEDWANGIRPRQFMTPQEVANVGGTTQWADGPGGKRISPTFGEAMDMKLLIQKPEKLDDGPFGLELDGKLYTPAYFSVDKSGYSRVGRTIMTEQALALSKTGLLAGLWHLSTDSEVINENPTIVPKIKLVSRTTEKFREEVMALFPAA